MVRTAAETALKAPLHVLPPGDCLHASKWTHVPRVRLNASSRHDLKSISCALVAEPMR